MHVTQILSKTDKQFRLIKKVTKSNCNIRPKTENTFSDRKFCFENSCTFLNCYDVWKENDKYLYLKLYI